MPTIHGDVPPARRRIAGGRSIRAAVLAATIAAFAGHGRAQIVWTGTLGSLLSEVGNWTGTLLSGTDVVFGNATTTNLTIPIPLTVGNVTFSATTPSRPAYMFSGSVTGTALTIAGNVNIAAGGDVHLDSNISVAFSSGAPTLTLEGALGGISASITKDGAGTLTLKGASAFAGAINVDAGALNVRHNTALGATTTGTHVEWGATLELQGGITVAEPLFLSGYGATSDDTLLGALRNVSGNNTASGHVTLQDDTGIRSDDGRLTITGGISGFGHNLKIAGDGETVVSSSIDLGDGTLYKESDGTLTLSAANNINGVVLEEGRLLIGHAHALGHSSLVVTSSSEIAATTDLTLHQSIEFGGSRLTVGLPDSTANLTLAGHVGTPFSTSSTLSESGNTRLRYEGAGKLTLAGSTWVDELTISAASGGSVEISGTTQGDTEVWLNSGKLILSSGYASFAQLSSAMYDGGADTTLELASGTQLEFYGWNSGTNAISYGGTIMGTGSLHLSGSASAMLWGTNTYSGGTKLSNYYTESDNPTLTVGSDDALGTGDVQVSGHGATLRAEAGGIVPVVATTRTIANDIKIDTPSFLDEYRSYITEVGLLLEGSMDFHLTGNISGRGSITKAGSAKVKLSGANTFNGLHVEEGTIEFASNEAAGSGPLVLGYDDIDVVSIATESYAPKAIFSSSAPTLYGLAGYSPDATLQLGSGTKLNIHQNLSSVYFGDITASGADAIVKKTGYGLLALLGTNSYSGGTIVDGGALIFASGSLPTNGSFTVGADGYAGYGGADVAAFLGKFDRANTHGSIGFDAEEGAITITSAIDLTGFSSSARLGSATHAILGQDAIITPGADGTPYRFGGGGGLLEVESPLVDRTTTTTDPDVVVDSPSTAPLTLRLASNGNAFSHASVTQSALVFATGALPADATLALGTGGYVGIEDSSSDADLSDYLSRISTGSDSIIGFDTAPTLIGIREISSAIDFTGRSVTPYLGSATFGGGDDSRPDVKLTGTITPGSDNTYRFAGFKGGAIEIASNLSGTRSVVIGSPNVFATLGNRQLEEYSVVFLSGDNSALNGNTLLYGGELALAHANALGSASNDLIVNPVPLPEGLLDEPYFPGLRTTLGNNPTFANAIKLNATLGLVGEKDFTLSGVISGNGGLWLDAEYSSTTVTLTGANTFGGGVYLERGTIEFAHNNAAGTGVLAFGTTNDTRAIFSTDAPTIYGLESDHWNARVSLEDGTILTINQGADVDTVYRGQLSLTGSEGGARIVKTGTGTLRLEGSGWGLNGLQGSGDAEPISADITAGTVVVGISAQQPLGTGSVRLSGGTLALDQASLSNDLLTVSGTLAGNGSFYGDGIVIGRNGGNVMTLSPGFTTGSEHSKIGFLYFNHLTLAPGGVYDWNLQSMGPNTFPVGDLVYVSGGDTLVIDIGAADAPFQINVTSFLPDGSLGLTGVQYGHAYAWTLFQSYHIEGFLEGGAQFSINAADHFFSALGPGSFFVSQVQFEGTAALQLNFVPVPEPSTWVLLIAGVGVVAFTTLRRRRR